MTKSIEEEIMIKAQQARGTARYMASVEDLVEERIRKAREKGDFDNLAGKGKPINLEENPMEPADMRMANKILKDAGFAPYWIQLGNDIDAAQEQLWRDIERFKNQQRVIGKGKSNRTAHNLEYRAQKFLLDSREQLQNINKKIDNFNCHCPMWWLSRGRVDVDKEMEKVNREIQELLTEINRVG
ncbi:MAG: DnaJ family domain-containing protein [Chitinophagales bacterium]